MGNIQGYLSTKTAKFIVLKSFPQHDTAIVTIYL